MADDDDAPDDAPVAVGHLRDTVFHRRIYPDDNTPIWWCMTEETMSRLMLGQRVGWKSFTDNRGRVDVPVQVDDRMPIEQLNKAMSQYFGQHLDYRHAWGADAGRAGDIVRGSRAMTNQKTSKCGTTSAVLLGFVLGFAVCISLVWAFLAPIFKRSL